MGNTLRGKYQLIDGLPGEVQGGQGTIYYAKDITSSIDKIYIVKQFTPRYDSDFQLQVAKRLFIQEAKILQKLGSHSQIPQIFDYFEENEQFFLVQELIEGHNLKQELDDKKYFTQSEIIDILKDALEVLYFVHQNNYIHRDIKPSNLIRNKYDQKIYLIDFGAVKEKIKPENLNNQGNFTLTIAIGTPGYIPEEQTLGKPQFCSDIYALGMVTIQVLTGIRPRELHYDENSNPIWRDFLPTSKYDFNPNFLDLIDRMVRCNYQQRYQSVVEVLQDLTNLATNQVKSKNYHRNSNRFNPNQSLNHHPKNREKSSHTLLSWLTVGLGGIIVGLGTIFLASETIWKEKYVSYENSDYGITIDHPQNWSIQEEDGFFNPGIIFFSPQENDKDNFREKVKISVEKLSIHLSLKEYTEQAIKEIERGNSIIEQPQNTILANREGRKIIYQEKDSVIKRMQVWTIKNKKAYIATYTAEADKFNKFLKQADKIIQSLNISN